MKCWTKHRTLITLVAMANLLVHFQSEPEARGGNRKNSGPSYSIIELDHVDGQIHGYPNDINDNGLVVGVVSDPETGIINVPACWTLTETNKGISSILHTLLGGNNAHAVNDDGVIVGDRNTEQGVSAVYWENWADTQPVELPTLELTSDEPSFCSVYNVNNQRLACGWCGNIESGFHAVVWQLNSEGVAAPLKLPSPFNGGSTIAHAIANADEHGLVRVVGSFWDPSVELYSAVAWTLQWTQGSSPTVLDGPDILDVDAIAHGLNDEGAACGVIDEFGLGSDGVVWQGGSFDRLDRSATFTWPVRGRLSFDSAVAYDMNDAGVIVGRGQKSVYNRAVVWQSPTAPMVLLGDFVGPRQSITSLDWANAINTAGQIVGRGWDHERQLHFGFLAVPSQ